MTWIATSRQQTGRFVAFDGEAWSADAATTETLNLIGPFGPALLTPVGPVYQPRSDLDDIALYLNALSVLPGGATVTGDAPALPEIPAVPAGAVA